MTSKNESLDNGEEKNNAEKNNAEKVNTEIAEERNDLLTRARGQMLMPPGVPSTIHMDMSGIVKRKNQEEITQKIREMGKEMTKSQEDLKHRLQEQDEQLRARKDTLLRKKRKNKEAISSRQASSLTDSSPERGMQTPFDLERGNQTRLLSQFLMNSGIDEEAAQQYVQHVINNPPSAGDGLVRRVPPRSSNPFFKGISQKPDVGNPVLFKQGGRYLHLIPTQNSITVEGQTFTFYEEKNTYEDLSSFFELASKAE